MPAQHRAPDRDPRHLRSRPDHRGSAEPHPVRAPLQSALRRRPGSVSSSCSTKKSQRRLGPLCLAARLASARNHAEPRAGNQVAFACGQPGSRLSHPSEGKSACAARQRPRCATKVDLPDPDRQVRTNCRLRIAAARAESVYVPLPRSLALLPRASAGSSATWCSSAQTSANPARRSSSCRQGRRNDPAQMQMAVAGKPEPGVRCQASRGSVVGSPM